MNIKSILALDEKIRRYEGTFPSPMSKAASIDLKRTRNSLLNISKLSSELLGNIFLWNVAFRGEIGGYGFDRLDEGSHNFLLVCHHWFEVASCTPELWSFWGTTLEEWARWHRYSGVAPLDLVLLTDKVALNIGRGSHIFDATLRNVLRDRANRDTIRRIHLDVIDPNLLNSIISTLTGNSEELQSSCIKSFIVHCWGMHEPIDISDFFAHRRFPKLQCIELTNYTISSWDIIVSRASVLTTLDLCFSHSELTPTITQLIPIFSCPTLRKISLRWREKLPDHGNPSIRASLPHLKLFRLRGDPQDVFELLSRLDNPANVDHLAIILGWEVIEDISYIAGPLLRDYLQRRGRPHSGLGLTLSNWMGPQLGVGYADGINFSHQVAAGVNTFVAIFINFNQVLPGDLEEKMLLNIVAYFPREEIIYLRHWGKTLAAENISTQLPNLRGLHLYRTHLCSVFSKSNLNRCGQILSSLQCIWLDRVVVDDGDWSPLTTFLDRCSSDGTGFTLLYCDFRLKHPVSLVLLSFGWRSADDKPGWSEWYSNR